LTATVSFAAPGPAKSGPTANRRCQSGGRIDNALEYGLAALVVSVQLQGGRNAGTTSLRLASDEAPMS